MGNQDRAFPKVEDYLCQTYDPLPRDHQQRDPQLQQPHTEHTEELKADVRSIVQISIELGTCGVG